METAARGRLRPLSIMPGGTELFQGRRAVSAAVELSLYFPFRHAVAMPLLTADREAARNSMGKVAALDFLHLHTTHSRPILEHGPQAARRAAAQGP